MSTVLRIVRRSWVLLLALAVIGGAVGAAVWAAVPRTYSATSEAFVSTNAAKSVDDLNAGATLTQQLVKSYVDVATTPLVLNPVIRRLGLDTDADRLADRVTAEAPLETVVIKVTTTDASAAQAAKISNAIVRQMRGAVTQLSPDPTSAAATIKLTQIRTATPPQQPSGLALPIAVLLGVLAGLLLGFVVGYARDRADEKVRSPQGLRRTVGAPLLGTTTDQPRRGGRPAGEGTATAAVRALAVSLEFIPLPADRRSVVITSATAREGRSTTAVDLAVLLAESGQRVLLVDGDLRHPAVAKRLGLEGGIGLSDVLTGRVGRGQATQRSGEHHLDVLAAGEVPANPGALVRSPALEQLIRETSAEYDIVLIDSPPLLAASDAAVLAKRSAGAVLVAAVNRVRRPQVAAALGLLQQIDAVCLGVVATMVPGRGAGADGAVGSSTPRRPAVQSGTTSARPDAATT